MENAHLGVKLLGDRFKTDTRHSFRMSNEILGFVPMEQQFGHNRFGSTL